MLGGGRRHELTKCLEDYSELTVVPRLERIQLATPFFVPGKRLSQLDERAHDFDVDLNSLRAPQPSRRSLGFSLACPVSQ
jgi:hypothetical protein